MKHTYIAIDLKSFFASVECHKRGLNPLTTNLVVADNSRTEKTICLAVTPSLKSLGIPGRPRLFEVIQKVKEINYQRKNKAYRKVLTGSSTNYNELLNNSSLAVDYIVAMPHMADYIAYSNKIYEVYLKYIAPEDIHVYSIDEVFMDVTNYLKTYQMTAHELAMTIIQDVLKTTGITATAGIGTNLYLCKVAMDIVAKRIPADKDGVRIAEIDEMSYRKLLWSHRPLTDFWRVGKGYAKKLETMHLYTMGDIARYSLENEDDLYDMFGINAELLIDHAWGYESCTMKDIKNYKPGNKSIGSGQVLHSPYNYENAKVIIKEMAELLSLDLVSKKLVTDEIVLTIGYDIESLKTNTLYAGEVTTDYYGRKIPKKAHGTIHIKRKTASTKLIMEAVMQLYERIIDKNLLIRRVYIVANKVILENQIDKSNEYEQIDLFSITKDIEDKFKKEDEDLQKEKNLQKVLLDIKSKYGKNSVLKGMNLEKGATTKERNDQIGGHRA